MREETCRGCAGLVSNEGDNWICDQLDMEIGEIENGQCPEGMLDLVHFEIFITDLTDEARKRIEQIVGTDHNFDTFPLATVELMEGGITIEF
jgi:hypothetical protein